MTFTHVPIVRLNNIDCRRAKSVVQKLSMCLGNVCKSKRKALLKKKIEKDVVVKKNKEIQK